MRGPPLIIVAIITIIIKIKAVIILTLESVWGNQ